ncbi:MAG TPA: hypothetical protein VMF30_05490 [Pirellulales bacterium]|nr:hypothetical protein [Pirellulales bacterium]
MSKRFTILVALTLLASATTQAQAEITLPNLEGIVQAVTTPVGKQLSDRAERALERYQQLVAKREQMRRARENSPKPAGEAR